ncbi:MAG: hypothetical protein HYX87_04555 [Chloroflexi bacterium]|nr:hypothetical protein [Chloroflexota bacterium]
MKRILTVTLCFVLVVLALGCSKASVTTTQKPTTSSSAAPKTTATTSAQTTAKTTSAPPPTSAAPKTTAPATTAPQRGGTLKIIFASAPSVLGYPAKMGVFDWFSAEPALESLVVRTTKLNPGLATDWKPGPDGRSLILNLRKGVKFHDGTDFNAEAVKFNIDLLKQEKVTDAGVITSADVLDTYTVRLNLVEWNSALLDALSFYAFPMISPTAVKTKGVDWVRVNPVGTGPFKLASFQRDVSVKYERFADYWDKGKPYLDGIEIRYVADPLTALASFSAGEAQVYFGTASANPKPPADAAQKGFRVDTVPSNVAGLMPDSRNPDSPFADKRVRLALQYAVDNAAIVKAISYGQWSVATQVQGPSSPAYSKDIKPYLFDPAKAKQLLSEAGYANGFKTRILATSRYANRDALVALQGYLKGVNIQADIEMVEIGPWEGLRKEGWKNGLMHATFLNSNGPFAGDLRRLFPADYTFYPSTQRPPGYGELVSKAISATDADVAAKLNQDLNKLLYDEVMWASYWHTSMFGAKWPEVHDDGMATSQTTRWLPGDAWLSSKK